MTTMLKCRVCGKKWPAKYGFEVIGAKIFPPICPECEQKERKENEKCIAEMDEYTKRLK